MKVTASFCLIVAIGFLSIGCKSDQKAFTEEAGEQTTCDSTVVDKLNSIIIPVVDFENTTAEEAFDFLRLRVIAYDRDQERRRKGHSPMVRKSRPAEDSVSGELSNFNPYSASLDHARITYSGRHIPIIDVIAEICRQSELDAYVASVGIVVTPEGKPPFPEPKVAKGGVLKVLRKAE